MMSERGRFCIPEDSGPALKGEALTRFEKRIKELEDQLEEIRLRAPAQYTPEFLVDQSTSGPPVTMKITAKQSLCLDWIMERGGSGYIDRYGRVVAGGEKKPQGSATSWLHLVAKGLIGGSEDRIFVTKAAFTVLVSLMGGSSK